MIHDEALIQKSTHIWHQELSNIGKCQIGVNCRIHSHVWIGDGVEIGSTCLVQAFCFIPTGVKIGNRVFLGPRVTFTNDKYPPGTRDNWGVTIVEDDVVIGAGAVILPGIRLGQGCRIGAGAVVTHSVPPQETWVGNPARLISTMAQRRAA